MTDADLEVLTRGIAPIVKDAIARATEPLLARIAVLEQRPAPAPGRDGRDGAPGRDGDRGPAGVKGDPGEIGPAGRDGVNGADGRGEKGDPGDRGPAGEKGDPGAMGPKGDPGDPGPRGEKGDPGQVGEVGPIGPQGPVGLMGERGERGEKGIDGRDGRDGQDGITLGIDDLQGVTFDADQKAFVFTFGRGEHVKSWTVPVPMTLYRDVWLEGKTYQAGDVVTWGGAMWVAKEATSAKPGLPTVESRAWKLCVKAGRDGKVGPAGPKGADGRDGLAGKDLTQMDFEGRKW